MCAGRKNNHLFVKTVTQYEGATQGYNFEMNSFLLSHSFAAVTAVPTVNIRKREGDQGKIFSLSNVRFNNGCGS